MGFTVLLMRGQVDVILSYSLVDDDDDDDLNNDNDIGIDYEGVEEIISEVMEILKLAPYRMTYLFISF